MSGIRLESLVPQSLQLLKEGLEWKISVYIYELRIQLGGNIIDKKKRGLS